ncbi:MAG: hypothetical protein K0R51_424 [Cytophagaceae bacterium]|jgi:hypothetical protein|nr:hypothetical protein [Cytophagaceae bacterium]
MHSNSVTIKHIKSLEDSELCLLLDLLLHAEAASCNLQSCVISVPQNINVTDGGEDGRITWEGLPLTTDKIKNQFTIFQCKATKMSAQDCYDEIIIQDDGSGLIKLKPQIEEVVKKNGSYILLTTQPLTSKIITPRIASIRKAIRDARHANFDSFKILLYDANIICQWVNKYTAAVTFVQKCNDISRPNSFRTWEEWQRDMPGANIPFQSNDILEEYINNIRDTIETDKVVRVIGPSGLGKTRLVLEVFRDDKQNSKILDLQRQLIYCDLGLTDVEKISDYIISHRETQSAIFVLDNCIESSHIVLSHLVNSVGNFKIITIDFDSGTSERSVIMLDRNNQKDIVKKIVQDIFKDSLTSTQKELIAEISEGFPQMAIMFSESVKADGWDERNNELPEDYLTKLIFARQDKSNYDYHVIKACSVLSSFGFVNDTLKFLSEPEQANLKKQSEYVRLKICGSFEGREVTDRDFYRICEKYRKYNIIEQRGRKIMVKPTPLAMNLAAKWWLETSSDFIKEILIELKDDELGLKFVERMRELDHMDKAKSIVKELYGVGGPFGTAEVLNTKLGSLLFRYVVEVNPEVTVQALNKAIESLDKAEIFNLKEGRRNLVWALEKLCFRKETFEMAAKILYSFAVSENETWGNNSINQFSQLFQSQLAGTEVNLEERIKIIRWGLEKKDIDYTRIAILALSKGIQSSARRIVGAERQGNSVILIDYRPSGKEILLYWNEILSILTTIAITDIINSDLAKEKIASAIRVLIREGQISLVEESINTIIDKTSNLWIDASKALRITLAYEKDLGEGIIRRIEVLIDRLTPKDIKNKILLTVTKPEWTKYEPDSSGNIIDQAVLNVEQLVKQIIEEKIDIEDFLVDVLKGEQRLGFAFGKSIGKLDANSRKLIETAFDVLKTISLTDQNPEFIAGILFGLEDPEFFRNKIDEIIADERIRKHAFYFTKVLNGNIRDLDKLFVLVDKFGLSIDCFQVFQYGRALLEQLQDSELTLLCNRISQYDKLGKWTALSILHMYCFDNEPVFTKNTETFVAIIGSDNMLIDNSNRNSEVYHWSDSVTKILSLNNNNVKFAETISAQLIEFYSNHRMDYSIDGYLDDVIVLLLEKYFNEVWLYFGEALLYDSGKYSFHLEHILGANSGFGGITHGVAFRNTNNFLTIMNWCKKTKGAIGAIARIMPLMEKKDEEVTLHPFAISFINEFGNEDSVLSAISANLGTFGSVGSSIPYYKDQLVILNGLAVHNTQKVKEWATKMIEYTNRLIKREEIDDAERFSSE